MPEEPRFPTPVDGASTKAAGAASPLAPPPASTDTVGLPAELDPLARLAPGTLLRGTYHIVRRLSQGGMGEVYEATHARLAGRYAVKVLRGDLSQDEEATLRFRREAEITSRLRHPGIVNVIDFDATEKGEPYIVMEFLDGEDLGKLLARGAPRASAWIADVVTQIASALGAAHAHGVVHRDLKPQNVILVPSGGSTPRVKVLDFGISKMHALSQRLTRESTLLGTPPYMSPEQAVGRADDVDARADQFALATLTYELVTGRRPFDGENVMAVFYQIVNVDPPPMRTWVPALSPAAEAVVRKGLAKSREARFARIEDFAAALAEALRVGGEEAGARAEPPARAVARPRRSRRVVLALGVAVGLGATVGAMAWWLSRRVVEHASTPTSTPTATTPPTPVAPTPAAPPEAPPREDTSVEAKTVPAKPGKRAPSDKPPSRATVRGPRAGRPPPAVESPAVSPSRPAPGGTILRDL